jgi:hypothetical protein
LLIDRRELLVSSKAPAALTIDQMPKGQRKMNLPVAKDQFKNIYEIWQIGPNSIQVVTANHRTIRISARGNIRSAAAPRYAVHYEEQVEIEPRRGQRLWVLG